MLPEEWKAVVMAFFPSAMFSAFAGFVRLSSIEKRIEFGRAIATVSVSVFVGVLTAIFARHYGVDWDLTFALSGLAAFSGKSLLAVMSAAMERLVVRFADRLSDGGEDGDRDAD